MEQKQTIEISSGSILRFIFIILFLLFLYLVRDVIVILLFAIIIASAINPFGRWLDKKQFPRLLGILILYFVLFGLFVFLFSLSIPFIAEEVSQLSESLPRFLAKFSASLEKFEATTSSYFDVVGPVQELLDNLSGFLQQASQSIFSFVASIFGGIFSFVAILVISFYLSVMRNGIESFLKAVTPEDYEGYVIDLWKRSEAKLGRWLRGQLLLALIVGLATYIGLSLLDVKFALVLAFIAMVLELVPNVGPVLAAIPAVIVALLQSPALGLWVVLLYVIIQQVENHILVPLVLSRAVGVNPVVVIIALLIGFKVGGVPGMILAVPIVTVVVEFFDDIAAQKEKRKSIGEATVTNF